MILRSLPVCCSLALSVAAAAQGKTGTVIVAHGGDAGWNAPVVALGQSVKTDGPVEVSFLMGPGAAGARFQDVVAKLERAGVQRIVVVPLLVSSHSGHYDQIRWLAGDSLTLDETMHHHLHMAGITRSTTRLPIHVARAIDDSPDVARVLAERARPLATAPDKQALFIVGHGPNSAEDNAHWMRNLRVVADSVRALTGFSDVKVGVVRDDAPATVRAEAVTQVRDVIGLQARATGMDVVVVPILISKGSVSRDKLPADLAGMPVVYSRETLVPHPAMGAWVEARVRETLKAVASGQK